MKITLQKPLAFRPHISQGTKDVFYIFFATVISNCDEPEWNRLLLCTSAICFVSQIAKKMAANLALQYFMTNFMHQNSAGSLPKKKLFFVFSV